MDLIKVHIELFVHQVNLLLNQKIFYDDLGLDSEQDLFYDRTFTIGTYPGGRLVLRFMRGSGYVHINAYDGLITHIGCACKNIEDREGIRKFIVNTIYALVTEHRDGALKKRFESKTRAQHVGACRVGNVGARKHPKTDTDTN